jgi:hypothetical protein
MPPSLLPIEAREAAGKLLWQRLLAEPEADTDDEDAEPAEDEAA